MQTDRKATQLGYCGVLRHIKSTYRAVCFSLSMGNGGGSSLRLCVCISFEVGNIAYFSDIQMMNLCPRKRRMRN